MNQEKLMNEWKEMRGRMFWTLTQINREEVVKQKFYRGEEIVELTNKPRDIQQQIADHCTSWQGRDLHVSL